MSCCRERTFIPLGSPTCAFHFNAIRRIVFAIAGQSVDPSDIASLARTGDIAITPKLYNVTADKPESTFQEFDDGTRFFIREAPRTITAVIPKGVFHQIKAFKNIRCKNNIGIYLIDSEDQILGYTTDFFPIPINTQTLDPIFNFATDTTVSNITLTLQLDSLVKDENLFISKLDDGTVLDYIPIYAQNMNVNLSASTVTTKLYTHNNSIELLYLNNLDLAPTGLIEGTNLTNSAPFTINYSTPLFNPLTNVITLTITSATGVVSGDNIRIERITTNPPFSRLIVNKPNDVA